MNKSGCILINEYHQIALVYRTKRGDYSFPKGHMEEGETLLECGLRETEEETGRMCHALSNNEIGIMSYTNSEGEIKTYMFLAADDGASKKVFKEEDKEVLVWVDYDKVYDTLSYDNLKEFWLSVETKIKDIIQK